MPGEPSEAMNREILPACFEPGEVAGAHSEPFRKGFARPAAFLAQLHDPQADTAQQLSGILAPHSREERATALVKR